MESNNVKLFDANIDVHKPRVWAKRCIYIKYKVGNISNSKKLPLVEIDEESFPRWCLCVCVCDYYENSLFDLPGVSRIRLMRLLDRWQLIMIIPILWVNPALLPPANEVWGKAMFYTCLSFCSRGRGMSTPFRVATAQGKQGIWFWHREKFANSGKIFGLWLLT